MNHWLGWVLLLLVTSCQFFERRAAPVQGKPLARVGDRYLYASDIDQLGLSYATPADSARMVRDYIDSWIRRELMYTYALENLPPDKQNVDQLIEDYRKSLLIYRYEREYIEQNLDTSLSSEEARAFYEANKQNFLLTENLYRIQYIKVAVDAPHQDSIPVWIKTDDPFVLLRWEQYVDEFGIDYNINDSTWMSRSAVINVLPFMAEYAQWPLYTLIEEEVTPYHYYVWITEERIKDQPAPFRYVRQEVERMIINRRKLDLKKEFNDNIYKDAAKNNTFERLE